MVDSITSNMGEIYIFRQSRRVVMELYLVRRESDKRNYIERGCQGNSKGYTQ